jgi:hypothetical protein
VESAHQHEFRPLLAHLAAACLGVAPLAQPQQDDRPVKGRSVWVAKERHDAAPEHLTCPREPEQLLAPTDEQREPLCHVDNARSHSALRVVVGRVARTGEHLSQRSAHLLAQLGRRAVAHRELVDALEHARREGGAQATQVRGARRASALSGGHSAISIALAHGGVANAVLCGGQVGPREALDHCTFALGRKERAVRGVVRGAQLGERDEATRELATVRVLLELGHDRVTQLLVRWPLELDDCEGRRE